MMAKEESGRIPSAYQEVEWVGTNGQRTGDNAVIDTEYAPTQKPKAEFLLQQNATGSKSVLGLDTSNSAPKFALYTASGNFYYLWGNSTNTVGMNAYSTSAWYEISAGISLVVDGSTKATKTATDWSSNTKTVKLFYGPVLNIQCRIGEFKLYDDTNIVRDLVPCYRKSDNRCGFYCLITNRFYTCAGAASTLTKGGNVT
jgi:hypothetical protein